MQRSSDLLIVASGAGFSAARMTRTILGTLAVVAGLLGVVGAFGVAPDSQVEGLERRTVSTALDLSPTIARPDTVNSSDVFWREERVQKGDSVLAVLSRLQVEDADLVAFLQASIRDKKLPSPSAARSIATATDFSGSVLELRIRGDSWGYTVLKTNVSYMVVTDSISTDRRVVMQSGSIDSSLFAATDDAGIPDSVASDFAELFSGEVDLHRDIRRGDQFAVVYEMIYSHGVAVRPGRILAAEFINQGRRLQAVFFEGGDGTKDYFTPSGRSMRQAFLRSPLEFSRVTSGFSTSRFHPVLQVWRAHKGTDYGAPIGTRVRSTSDGVVVFAGWQNGYGKVIEIRHNGNLTTKYGHLSDFSALARIGGRVEQGDVIGFVGMTGLASGPHLHYEFHVNGVQADPQRSVPQQGPSISAGSREAFLRSSSDSLAQLDLLRGLNVAAQE
jgi:murein DD-endopeptidase MepM/ murein hydrolase activator NlpD